MMLKLLLFVVLVANLFLIVSSTSKDYGTADQVSSESSSYSSSRASSSSSSSSFSSSNTVTVDSTDNSNTESGGDCSSPGDNNNKCTQPHEVYDCPPSCGQQTCESIGQRYNCPFIPATYTKTCKKTCVCEPNYYKNKIGDCISKENCLKCSGPNEFYACGGACDNVCATLSQQNQTSCPIINVKCNEMCYCESGYARNDSGICVPFEECINNSTPGCNGDENAKPGCGVNCGKLCSNYFNPEPVSCIDICYPNGCNCNEGYFLDTNINKCVLPEQCSPVCGANEVYNDCANGGCYGPRNCSQIGGPTICVDLIEGACKGGCLCKDDYLRNENGECVPPTQCPQVGNGTCTKPNEVYDLCPTKCPARTCGIDDRLIFCIAPPEVGSPDCPPPTCRCQDGFYRNDQGDCVTWEQCSINETCQRQNEVYDLCPARCPFRTCGIDDRLLDCAPSPQVGDADCLPPICRCQDGLYRDDKGNCVQWEECPQCNNPNEVYDACPNPCPPQRCDVDERVIRCKAPPKLGDAECQPGCRCEDGYKRDSKGVCIPKKKCEKGCNGDPNAKSGCGVNCGRLCSNYNSTDPIACILICYVNGCDCKEDYVFDSNTGKCVLPENCTPVCKLNEVFSNCTQAVCEAQTCKEKGQPVACPLIAEGSCEKGCLCKPNYYRAENGTCIPGDQCDSENCPNGGVYNTCPPQPCDAEYCPKNRNSPQACISTKNCGTPRCTCGFNQKRDRKSGKCIATSSCPPFKCDGPNEEYQSCPARCPGETCTDFINNSTCNPLGTKNDIVVPCQPQCRCKKNYYRNAQNICVKKNECKKAQCNKPNEVYDACPNPCPAQRCDVDERVIRCKAPPKLGDPECQPGCRCEDGYKRDSKGVCIPKNKCGKCFKPNEVYDACPNPCPPQRCDVDERVIKCKAPPKLGDPECQPGCRCKDGYKKDSRGVCIPKNKCEKGCNGDPNAKSGCGVNCGRLCSNYNSTDPIACILICNLNGCDCNEDYVFDSNTGKCVLPENCTPVCKVNEMFSNCTQAVCEAQTCKEKGQPVACPSIAEGSCIKGCLCQPNYYRANNGTCIPEDQCDSDTCPNGGVYNTCPPQPCDAEYCPKNRNSPQTCISPKNCGTPRCTCGFNQKRDRKTGKCIATSSCPPFKCDGPNEEYKSCPARCPGETCKDFINNSTCNPLGTRIGIVVPCQPQCRCKKNYYRNAKNVCVKSSECKKGQTTPAPAPVDYNDNSDVQQQLSDGILNFTLSALKVQNSKEQGNYIASFFSVEILLAQLALYSNGKSYDQLTSALKLYNNDDIKSAFKSFLTSLQNLENVEFIVTGKDYVNQNFELTDDVKNTTKQVFGAEIETIDCSQPEQAAATINEWVEKVTNGRIKDLVQASLINELTRLVLVNAIYFKGTWQKAFNKNDTMDRDFYTADGKTVQVPTMYQKSKVNYAESSELDCKVLELFYQNGDFSFLVLLPNKVDGLNKLVEDLNESTFKNTLASLRNVTVKVYLPTMKIEKTTDLKQLLEEMNITAMFDPAQANIKGMLTSNETLYASAAVQKAYLEVTEEGSEAAAATAILISALAAVVEPPEEITFIADHPFIFFINYKNNPMFCGAFQTNQ